MELGDYDKAIEYLTKSLKFKEDDHSSFDLDRLLINMGICHDAISSFQKAKYYLDEGFKTCGDHCSDQIKIEGLAALGSYFYKTSNFSEAKKCFLKSYGISKKFGNKRFQAIDLLGLARIYRKFHQGARANHLLKEAEAIVRDLGYRQQLADAYIEYANLFYETKDFEQLASYQKKYLELRDTIYN